ncbi:alpha/beta hydrolase family protein [Psychrobium sp. nBUS_13]|uniref:alpha/beta hydrolase family protein n=1 Tax=Psychrobium sp. nBUS_13 TaxID=3395319 RepID=UPI003EBDF2DB
MKTIVLFMLAVLSNMVNATQPPSNTQVIALETKNPLNNRPIKLRIWYPKKLDAECIKSQMCLAPNVRKDQAILLMHGAMGSVKSHNWIGYAMASHGFVVVGIDHFGESWSYGIETMKPSSVLSIDLRPADVKATLDQLSSNRLAGSDKPLSDIQINWTNITAIGHSSGGMAALMLAGAQADKKMALDYCGSKKSVADRSCLYTKGIQAIESKSKNELVSFKDDRVKRLIALDPADGHLLTSKSLQRLTVPLLVVGSQQNDFLPFKQHAKRFTELVPNATLVSLNNGEGHFVYLDQCTHTHKAMGVSLCEDRKGVNRAQVHQKLYPAIFKFISTQRRAPVRELVMQITDHVN